MGSDHAGRTKDRKSVGGYIFINGGPISWRSRSQTVIALSLLEAEYIGCSDATHEAIWLRRLTREIIGDQPPVQIFGDNQGVLKLIKSGIVQVRTKHRDVKFQHVHDEVTNKKTVAFDYIHTSRNIADFLTRPLPVEIHHRMLRFSGMLPAKAVDKMDRDRSENGKVFF
jgi:hypothetical protein